MSGGAEANQSGLTWEAWVRTFAKRQGFEVLGHSLRSRCTIPEPLRRIVWTHVPYRTIFQNIKNPSKASTEYLVECGTDRVRIECKWQGVAGSVDEKYPFMFLNAALTMIEDTVVFALGGEYFETGKGAEVRNWLTRVCATPPEWFSEEIKLKLSKRQLLVLTPNTFAKWFRERFPV
ncbi:MAG: PD-(D/E)XK nuclease superfamily protein [Fibrobacterota bacterium]